MTAGARALAPSSDLYMNRIRVTICIKNCIWAAKAVRSHVKLGVSNAAFELKAKGVPGSHSKDLSSDPLFRMVLLVLFTAQIYTYVLICYLFLNVFACFFLLWGPWGLMGCPWLPRFFCASPLSRPFSRETIWGPMGPR